ncbi:MarR family transcriptional regulator [Pseudonocardia kujensis]|uniref:MarR family winged helix-turn-helix transcriptional regulator n=1 Tax=Pseudonocardia kujensis TaxID=1128675 RepID=UPI001E4BD413|nr:MarR family transcriptional regulator [Pseudonocardia kujensis]MCE0765500.1 MarR family transcriptional regulator [Pseudonocardia kujensis]
MSAPTSTSDDVLRLVVGMRRVLRRRLRARFGRPPLRGAQAELLQQVEAEPGIGVAAAARALYLAGNSVSTLVNQLVDDGLLRREADPADRRAVRLFLTPGAVDRLARRRAARRELLDDAFARLDTGERTAITAALPALERLLAALEEPPVPEPAAPPPPTPEPATPEPAATVRPTPEPATPLASAPVRPARPSAGEAP